MDALRKTSVQAEARRLREHGARRITAPSAALERDAAQGFSVDRGVCREGARDGMVIVLFDAPAGVLGWIAADSGSPSAELLERVHHYAARPRSPRTGDTRSR